MMTRVSITRLDVDLGAISRNLELLRTRAAGRAAFVAVKANAYGHGLVEVARHLEGQVAGFGVATVEEGQQLRDAGITVRILKLSATIPDELPAAIAAGLTLVVGSPEGIGAAARAAEQAGTIVDVHLKIDTGMRRIGVEPDDALASARAIADAPSLRLDGLMTHLAIADTEDGRDTTARQLATFRRIVDEVTTDVGPVPWIHSANSAGILNHPLDGDNAIRPGIAMYGSAPEMNRDDGDLEPVSRWTTRVTMVKRVAAGEPVSYGHTWTSRDTWIGTIAVGYGDGYSRLNSNRGRVLIDGETYPIVGRVCMDQSLIDLGEHTDVQVGDEVVLMGSSGEEHISVQEIADVMGTIPYEVTCLITPRVERRYVTS